MYTSSRAAGGGLVAVVASFIRRFVVVEVIVFVDDALLLQLRQLVFHRTHRSVAHRVVGGGRGERVVCGPGGKGRKGAFKDNVGERDQ